MKVAHISLAEIPSNKANSIQVMKISQALQQIGESVTLYIAGSGSVNWEELAAKYGIHVPFPVVRIGSGKILRQLSLSLAGVKQARWDGMEMVFSRTLWVAFIASLRGFPAVLELHDLPSGRFGPLLYRWLLRTRKPVLMVYITEALKTLTDQTTGMQARRGSYLIAPDGVDLSRYADLPGPVEARTRLNLPQAFTAVYTGGFYPGRGIDTLEYLAVAFPDVHFMWIGGTPDQVAYWRQWVESRGLQNVSLTGFIQNSDVPLYQTAADVLLMPYSQKFGGSGGGDISSISSPMKLFEYLASGRCILASDLPVLHEVLDETCTLFYQPDDLEDLKNKFTIALADADLRARLGDNARHKAAAYDWKTRMVGIMNAMRDLLNT
jgi:glycosyltransferase involved in cell wall biosynthesis